MCIGVRGVWGQYLVHGNSHLFRYFPYILHPPYKSSFMTNLYNEVYLFYTFKIITKTSTIKIPNFVCIFPFWDGIQHYCVGISYTYNWIEDLKHLKVGHIKNRDSFKGNIHKYKMSQNLARMLSYCMSFSSREIPPNYSLCVFVINSINNRKVDAKFI